MDATGLDETALTDAIASAVRTAVAGADERPILGRLTLTGTTNLHGALLNDSDRLIAECSAAAIEANGRLWVESVKIGTRPPAATDAGSLTDLRDAFFAGLSDPDIVTKLLAEFANLRQKIPAPARGALDLPADDDDLRQMAEDAWQIAAAAIEKTAER